MTGLLDGGKIELSSPTALALMAMTHSSLQSSFCLKEGIGILVVREIACLSQEQYPCQRSAAFPKAFATMMPLAEQPLNPYEQQRAERIARNNRVLGKFPLRQL